MDWKKKIKIANEPNYLKVNSCSTCKMTASEQGQGDIWTPQAYSFETIVYK